MSMVRNVSGTSVLPGCHGSSKVEPTWGDEGKKLKLRRALVWHRGVPTLKATATTVAPPHQDLQAFSDKIQEVSRYLTQPSQPSDRACAALSHEDSSHPQELHVCHYCLIAK